MAKVGTFENKKVHKHLHLWPLGPHRRRLAVTAGTSKGSTISQYGCSTFGALATEDKYKEEEGDVITLLIRCVVGCMRRFFLRHAYICKYINLYLSYFKSTLIRMYNTPMYYYCLSFRATSCIFLSVTTVRNLVFRLSIKVVNLLQK